MAVFDESKVINALHPEKAEIGKKYWRCDNLLELKRQVEKNITHYIGELLSFTDNSLGCPFHLADEYDWQFLYPYEEPSSQRMTNRQLLEWLSKRNGFYCVGEDVYNTFYCLKKDLNNEVAKGIKIYTWDSDEWVEPTLDVYERDCKHLPRDAFDNMPYNGC